MENYLRFRRNQHKLKRRLTFPVRIHFSVYRTPTTHRFQHSWVIPPNVPILFHILGRSNLAQFTPVHTYSVALDC